MLNPYTVSTLGAGNAGPHALRHKEIDHVHVAAIDDRCYRVAIDKITSTADQSKAPCGKVDYRWCQIDAAIEPWFHSVLIGRQHVSQMHGLQ
jgi:hypothetical protein